MVSVRPNPAEAAPAPPAPAEGARPHAKPWPRYERAALGLRNYWYPALPSSQVRGKPVGFTILGEELVLVRRDGQVYCLEGRCRHRGVPLAAGRFQFPCTISCAYHGWTYDLASGELVAALTDGPESSIVGKVRLRTYPAQERQGIIWVFVGDDAPPPLEADVPPEFLDPESTVAVRVKEFPGNWRLAIEGSLDPSHAFFLHRFAWMNAFSRMPAARTYYEPETIDERYVGYKGNRPLPEAEYPRVGRWPPRLWWRRFGRTGSTKVIGWLPGAARVEGNLGSQATVYSWYVPVDKDNYRWFQILWTRSRGLGRVGFWLKYYGWWYWLYQRQFLGQDAGINGLIHPFYAEQDGWARERLYRPDVVITHWRKFVDQYARGIQEK